MTILFPFRVSPIPLCKIHHNPRWHHSRAMFWENRLLDMMASPLPFDAKRNARLHSLLLRVNCVKAAASMTLYLLQDEWA